MRVKPDKPKTKQRHVKHGTIGSVAAVTGAIGVVIYGAGVGKMYWNLREDDTLCLRELCYAAIKKGEKGLWRVQHGWETDCAKAAKKPIMPVSDETNEDAQELKERFATACTGTIPAMNPPYIVNSTGRPASIDAAWFCSRNRPFVAAWCLLQTWSRPLPSPPSTQALPVTTTAAVCALIAVSLHPIELLYVAYPTRATYHQSISSDIRRVCYLYPGQCTVRTGPFILSSRFESGSMGRSSWSAGDGRLMVKAKQDRGSGGNRMWFMFSVKRASETSPKSVVICITHLGRNLALYKPKEGAAHRPVVAYSSSGPFKRVDVPPKLEDMPGTDDKAILKFQISFEEGNTATVAFTYPYTYANLMKSISTWGKQYTAGCRHVAGPVERIQLTPPFSANERIMYSCETISVTPDGFSVPMMTITADGEDMDGRQYIVVTSRVHAGEVPASHMCHGVLSFLLSNDSKARKLRNRYIFKVVPMLNPDGVVRGLSRADGKGVDLNRVYDSPDRVLHGSIWGIIKVLEGLHATQSLYGYLDLHAHARKRSVFAYGNKLTGDDEVLQNVFAFLVGLRCALFDYHGCNFTDADFLKKDKLGTGRKAVGQRFGIPITLTIEANYSNGDVTHFRSAKPVRSQAPPFTPQTFHSLGSALVEPFQDLYREADPSRDSLPEFGNVERVRRYVSSAPLPGTRSKKNAAVASSPTADRQMPVTPPVKRIFRM
eukprot:TRINITY_DN16098_c0_g1_i1.p1 TRINITY_DN16098_c0_g1~~TRINITY_DN16098_c0_g1_i1.p1  ORF type:complete len:715 (+),score=40.94 TRINITY_DN16098_c0_g1_i1:32-2176(+)